jgi:hypothetical protein
LTAPGASSKIDAHVGAFSLARGAPETADIDAELGPTPAAIVAHRHPKVSKIGSPRRLDVVGENLIENRCLKCRIRPTPVSRRCGLVAPPPGRSHL